MKYICKDCAKPCEIIVEDGSDTPMCCPYRLQWKAVNWYEVDENIEPVTDRNQSTTSSSQLPDWCKVGEWVYYFDEVDGHNYQKIDKIDDKYIYFYRKFDRSKPSDPRVSDRVVYSVFIENTKPARLLPYNAEEMKALVGKVVEFDVFAQLVLMYDGKDNAILAGDGDWISEGTLLKDYTINGKPAGVLEHLENGEWVQ